jgi:phage tail protein X
MATASGTINGATWSGKSSWSYNTTGALYAGYSGDGYWVTFIKFTTPSFTGVSVSAKFDFYTYGGYGSTANIRWAICTSDANHSKYSSTTSAVSDSYQIASGTAFFGSVSSNDAKRTINVTTATLKPNTTYYLALWSSDKTGLSIRQTGYSYGAASMSLTSAETYTVTYNANGHGTAPSAQTVTSGTRIILPDMTANGFLFLGWATSPTATSGTTGLYSVTANVTLYAIWQALATGSYVYYNDNGTAVKCEVYYKVNGVAVRCDVYYNDNGTAVKM